MKKHTWRSYEKHEFPEEKEFLLKVEQDHSIEEAQRKAKRLKEANSFWNSAAPVLSHPYLDKKQIPANNLKATESSLHVPFYDMEGNLATLQSIDAEGGKRFFRGLSTKGFYHLLGDLKTATRIIFCEGYATGSSIYLATNLPTVICGSANNLPLVGRSFKQKYPDKLLVLASDNDEAGIKSEEEWKKFVSQIICRSPAKSDFNDLHCQKGLEEVKKILAPPRLIPTEFSKFVTEDIPEEKWVTDLFKEASFNIIYGTGGVGKSRLAHEMAFCISLKEPFLDYQTFQKKKVLIVDGEMTRYEVQQRFLDLARRYSDCDVPEGGLNILCLQDSISQFGEDLNLYQEEHRERISAAFQEVDFIVLDNLGSLTTTPDGEGYKIDRAIWEKFFQWLKSFKHLNKTILLVMHANKQGALEGVGKIRNDADTVLEITRPTDFLEDSDVLINFRMAVQKGRSIPEFKKKPLEASLIKSMKKHRGWKDHSKIIK